MLFQKNSYESLVSFISRCASKFSEADIADLKETGTKIASYKCFKHTLQSACQDRVKAQVYGFFQVWILKKL